LNRRRRRRTGGSENEKKKMNWRVLLKEENEMIKNNKIIFN
jgi:hypothetical protein